MDLSGTYFSVARQKNFYKFSGGFDNVLKIYKHVAIAMLSGYCSIILYVLFIFEEL